VTITHSVLLCPTVFMFIISDFIFLMRMVFLMSMVFVNLLLALLVFHMILLRFKTCQFCLVHLSQGFASLFPGVRCKRVISINLHETRPGILVPRVSVPVAVACWRHLFERICITHVVPLVVDCSVTATDAIARLHAAIFPQILWMASFRTHQEFRQRSFDNALTSINIDPRALGFRICQI